MMSTPISIGENVDLSLANKIASFCKAQLIRLPLEPKADKITTGTQDLQVNSTFHSTLTCGFSSFKGALSKGLSLGMQKYVSMKFHTLRQ